jgi:hypothetical protein
VKRYFGRLAPLVAGVAVTLALAGCVNLPTGIKGLPEAANGDQGAVILTPVPPGEAWQPKEIVTGFLAAAGAEAGDPSSLQVAREYLTTTYAQQWKPSPAATIIDDTPVLTSIPISSHVTGGQSSDQVTLTSQHLESLVSANANEAGSILASQDKAPYVFDFDLVQQSGRWRIGGITGPGGVSADSVLLLTNSDFLRDYEPRNLYFPAIGASHTLVPFPVYVPDQGGSFGIKQLVDGLTSLPPAQSDWLYRAVTTAFPRGTKVDTQLPAHSNQAVVELPASVARAGPAALARMEAQLVWTLTNAPYSAGSGIGSVELQIGGKSMPLLPSRFASWVPSAPTSPLYFQTSTQSGEPQLSSVVSQSQARKQGPTYATEVLPNGMGRGPLTAVAVSPPSPDRPGGTPNFAGCRGKTVYVEPLLLDADLTTQTLPSDCTSLSWDDNGNLWVAAGSSVFRITPTSAGLAEDFVTIPASGLAQDTFSSVRVAPDGVRVAMIANDKSAPSVIVTSISHQKHNSSLVYLARSQQFVTLASSLTDPVEVSWWGPDHLLVLNKEGSRNQLYEVPLNGGQPTPVPTPAHAVSLTANGSNLAVGIGGLPGVSLPSVRFSRDLGGVWHVLAGASTPCYPG